MTFTVSVIAALLTFELAKFEKVGVVRTSCIIGLLVYLLSILFGNNSFVLVAFGASFVGMCSYDKFSRWHVLFASLVYSLLFKNLVPYLNGMGGALGFIAFLSVSSVFLLHHLYNQFRRRLLQSQE
jgi:hypothetical protein